MSKHTAGPWRYWTQKRTGGEGTCTFQNLKGEEVLRAVTVTITEADARLIAAAPDLLDALQAATEVLEILRRGHGVEVSEACYPALNDCRDAIAKATGNAS